ncbi:ABC transporter ATP-binding protein [Raineyella sp. W15-4]|uniref:iron ABC transporter ATP-binding protein n=1 Tax=Raineyella sp. W15-4 TaxID=3081651 RepID=UPI0029545450|nr:ATP-binding cassette domain-containing protein [Raineyella sp. W15-4]WOQ17669.1 ATP-binding cassette domain-containing protein [Raineyella sp. W15-4]
MIEISQVSTSYGRTRVVHDVDLTLQAGGITSLIGPNGAGKSTLLATIARLHPVEAGTIRVDGLDVARCDSRELARRLAILRQENHLAVRLTVRDLVSMGRFPHSGGRPGPTDLARIDEALGFLDLTGLADRYLDELSGGQRQRAYVAMVLAQDTEYILLDEPLNNLDMAHGVAMMRLLRRLADDLGKTVVIVVHDINFASVWSDRIVAMRDGRLVGEGPVEELITPAMMAEVFGLEFPIELIGGDRVGIYYRAHRAGSAGHPLRQSRRRNSGSLSGA